MLLKPVMVGTAIFGSTILYRRILLSLSMLEKGMLRVYGNFLRRIRLRRGTVLMMA